jgi:hypothetical protein
MIRNLVGSIYGRSSIKIAHSVPIRLQTWLPQTILVSDWLISKKSSLKPLGQMDRNLVGSILSDIDASYQVSIHFVKRFQRRRFLKISHVCKWIRTKLAKFREHLLYMDAVILDFNTQKCGRLLTEPHIIWDVVFSSPCQRQCELLPSLGVRRLLTFHILIFSSETLQPNEVNIFVSVLRCY